MKVAFDDKYYCRCLFWGIVIHVLSTVYVINQYPSVGTVLNFVSWVLLAMQMIRVLFLLRNNASVVIWWICICLLYLSYKHCLSRFIFEAFIYITGAYHIQYNTIIKTMRTAWERSVVSVITLAFFRILPTNIMYRSDGMVRNSLGFNHPNTLGLSLLVIAILVFTEKYENLEKKDIFEFSVLLGIIYFISNSRTSTILCLILVVVALWKMLNIEIRKVNFPLKKMFYNASLIFGVLFLIFGVVWLIRNYDMLDYNESLNELVSGRLRNAAIYYKAFPPKILGQRMDQFRLDNDNFTKLYLDSGFMVLLIRNGIFSFFLYIVGIIKSIMKANKGGNSGTIIALVLLIISMMLEQAALEWVFLGPMFIAFADYEFQNSIDECCDENEEKL